VACVTRFAPSPTGPLHLGHAFSALTAHDLARAGGGTMLLRIEDIDRARCRPDWDAAIFEDLRWLGLDWPEPVMRQSDRTAAHAAALDRLAAMGVLYPCSCTRGDIRAALSAPQEGAPFAGPDGPIYPGTCRQSPRARADANLKVANANHLFARCFVERKRSTLTLLQSP
jgi:glutamyl-Q tRNA(Asp) synthetase